MSFLLLRSGETLGAFILTSFIIGFIWDLAAFPFSIFAFNSRRYIFIDIIGYLVCILAIFILTKFWSDFDYPLNILVWFISTTPYFIIMFKNIKTRIIAYKQNHSQEDEYE